MHIHIRAPLYAYGSSIQEKTPTPPFFVFEEQKFLFRHHVNGARSDSARVRVQGSKDGPHHPCFEAYDDVCPLDCCHK
eukprot:jgi/Botrbrau1/578/Bobra.0010s0044.1